MVLPKHSYTASREPLTCYMDTTPCCPAPSPPAWQCPIRSTRRSAIMAKAHKMVNQTAETEILGFIHSSGIKHRTAQRRICISTKCNTRTFWTIFNTKLRWHIRSKVFYHCSPADDMQRFRRQASPNIKLQNRFSKTVFSRTEHAL